MGVVITVVALAVVAVFVFPVFSKTSAQDRFPYVTPSNAWADGYEEVWEMDLSDRFFSASDDYMVTQGFELKDAQPSFTLTGWERNGSNKPTMLWTKDLANNRSVTGVWRAGRLFISQHPDDDFENVSFLSYDPRTGEAQELALPYKHAWVDDSHIYSCYLEGGAGFHQDQYRGLIDAIVNGASYSEGCAATDFEGNTQWTLSPGDLPTSGVHALNVETGQFIAFDSTDLADEVGPRFFLSVPHAQNGFAANVSKQDDQLYWRVWNPDGSVHSDIAMPRSIDGHFALQMFSEETPNELHRVLTHLAEHGVPPSDTCYLAQPDDEANPLRLHFPDGLEGRSDKLDYPSRCLTSANGKVTIAYSLALGSGVYFHTGKEDSEFRLSQERLGREVLVLANPDLLLRRTREISDGSAPFTLTAYAPTNR